MSRPRMWMEVGIWPPPARAWKCPQSRTPLGGRWTRWWLGAGVVAAAVLGMILGMALGSIATLMLVGQIGKVCA